MVVLTAAVSLCGRAEAQQSGLFPLAPIRRQRVPCDREDPTYKIYKQQYFGYHPTCWRTFPAGWGCPSGEAPDFARSKRELPPGHATEETAGEGGSPFEDENPPPRQRPAPRIPAVPEDRSPFEMEGPPIGAPNVNPLPRGNAAPRTAPAPRGDRPFDDVPNQGAATTPSRNRSQARSAPTAPADGAPALSAPAGPPAAGSALRSERDDGEGEESTASTEGPLLGLSDSDLVRPDSGAPLYDPQAGSATAAADTTASGDVAPAPAAQPRRRIFGNLFSSLTPSWLRR
jgi:hypothetical protein